MRADPKPNDKITLTATKCAIMVSDSDRPSIRAERFELHQWMKRIALPDLKLVPGETLDMGRQSVELVPESRKGISEIEGKAARGAASEAGSRTSFNRRCVLDFTAYLSSVLP
jgi:hypothetical protein